MINFKKYISRTPRSVVEKYLDDLSANSSAKITFDHGLNGFKGLIATSTADDSPLGYYAIKAVDGSATVSAISIEGDNITDITIVNGDTLFGNFSSVTCTAGKVLVYIK